MHSYHRSISRVCYLCWNFSHLSKSMNICTLIAFDFNSNMPGVKANSQWIGYAIFHSSDDRHQMVFDLAVSISY